MFLTDLPQDILVDCITSRVPIYDIFSLLQTCRYLHNIVTNSRHLWNAVSRELGLPLDIPSGIDFTSPHIIRQTVRNALHAEHVFQKSDHVPIRITCLGVKFVPSQLETLSDTTWNWLLALCRKNVEESYLSCWCISPDMHHQLVSINVPGAVAFSAAISIPSLSVTVAVISQTLDRTALLQVFEISVSTEVDPMISPGSSILLADVSQDLTTGTFFRVELRDNVVAVGIARHQSFRVLLLDLKSKDAQILTLRNVEHPAFKISDHQIFTFTRHAPADAGIDAFNFDTDDHVYPKADGAMHIRNNSSLPTQNLDKPAWHLQMERLPGASQVFFTAEENTRSGIDTLTFLAEFSMQRPHFYGRIQIRSSFSAPSLPADFRTVSLTTPDTAIEHLSMGKSGRRAVWLERSLETNEYRLMKITFDWTSGSPSPSSFLPPGMVLPFELETCRALFLHEAKATLLLGLYTGFVYMIDL